MPEGSSVCDLGSGAGLPGIALALRRPDLRVTLCEPLLRRTTFLDHVVHTMGLTNVVVHRGRAEDLHGAAEFDVVTSRAVAPMDRLARWSLPLTRPDGLFLAMKGSSAADEVQQAARVLRSPRRPRRPRGAGGGGVARAPGDRRTGGEGALQGREES